jgi:hypothetical protein
MTEVAEWQCLALSDRLRLVALEASLCGIPSWMIGTLHEAVALLAASKEAKTPLANMDGKRNYDIS